MQYIDLLGSSDKLADLEAFAKGFFSVVDIDEYEERESSNYIGGQYFRAFSDGMHFKVCLSDEEGFDDFPYWIQIYTDDDEPDTVNLEQIVKSIVLEKLLTKGFRITRIVNIGTYEAKQINYEDARIISS